MKRKGRRGKGISKFTAGAIGIILVVAFSYGAYTKFANPFASPYTIHAVVLERQRAAAGLARPDRRRRRRRGHGRLNRARAASRLKEPGRVPGRRRDDDDQQQRPADPHRRDVRDPPADLPRGQLLRRPQPRNPERPRRAERPHVPDPAGHRAGAARPGADQPPGRARARTCRRCSSSTARRSTTRRPSFNRSVQYWLPAYQYSALVAHDALGIQPNDLSNYLAAQGTVAGRAQRPPADPREPDHGLQHDRRTRSRARTWRCSNTVVQLPRTLAAAIPAFNALNAAFPPLEKLAVALIPGVKSTGPTIDASLPFITQLRLLVQPSELQGLANESAARRSRRSRSSPTRRSR